MSVARFPLREAIERHAPTVGMPGESALTGMEHHFELLERWNRAHNLTRLEDPREAALGHWVDCLAGLALVEARLTPSLVSLVDVGSGGGFPGVVAAQLWPDRRVTLVESVRKKASFLQTLVRELGLPNAEVANVRAENLAAGSFGSVLTRATVPWEEVPNLGRLLAPTGLLAAWVSGEPSPQEWATAAAAAGLERPERVAYAVEGRPGRALVLAWAAG